MARSSNSGHGLPGCCCPSSASSSCSIGDTGDRRRSPRYSHLPFHLSQAVAENPISVQRDCGRRLWLRRPSERPVTVGFGGCRDLPDARGGWTWQRQSQQARVTAAATTRCLWELHGICVGLFICGMTAWQIAN